MSFSARGSGDCRRKARTHKHVRQEEFYFVVEGLGRIRVGDQTLTVPKHGAVLVGSDQLRQVFDDTDADVLWPDCGPMGLDYESRRM